MSVLVVYSFITNYPQSSLKEHFFPRAVSEGQDLGTVWLNDSGSRYLKVADKLVISRLNWGW